MKLDPQLVERFHQKYRKDESGCWLWMASTAGKGYGQIKLTGQRRQIYAHRLAYIIATGKDPGAKQLCHTCDNPKCVNPEHLFVGTSQDNHDDMKAKGRHTFGEKNTQAKLDEVQVQQIKTMLSLGVPQTKIGAAFGVHQVQISRIKTGKRWSHVK